MMKIFFHVFRFWIIKNPFVLLLLIGCIFSNFFSEARILKKCEAYKELSLAPMIENQWKLRYLCVMMYESKFDTALEKPKRGTYSYGILQLGSDQACKNHGRGGLCNQNCKDFTDEDLMDDIACAKKIENKFGFQYWANSNSKCDRLEKLPTVTDCLK
ncbi:hypothetical protein QAD02_014737 [Eretmocerus hayati]|uniref:Uncharacterized protein n=1 Tax=Eretmocerus hayati TaxID=131215 RepID=A0ACC2P6C5_9HYME|nr:hypothetical protein QAD02_014737 [Eretmocerus hayati]